MQLAPDACRCSRSCRAIVAEVRASLRVAHRMLRNCRQLHKPRPAWSWSAPRFSNMFDSGSVVFFTAPVKHGDGLVAFRTCSNAPVAGPQSLPAPSGGARETLSRCGPRASARLSRRAPRRQGSRPLLAQQHRDQLEPGPEDAFSTHVGRVSGASCRRTSVRHDPHGWLTLRPLSLIRSAQVEDCARSRAAAH